MEKADEKNIIKDDYFKEISLKPFIKNNNELK